MWINTSCVKYNIHKSKQEANAALDVFVCIWTFMKFSFCSKGKRYSIFFYTRHTSASLRAGCLKCCDGLAYLLIQYLTFPRGKMANINNSKLLWNFSPGSFCVPFVPFPPKLNISSLKGIINLHIMKTNRTFLSCNTNKHFHVQLCM